jgi:hypothetical protein
MNNHSRCEKGWQFDSDVAVPVDARTCAKNIADRTPRHVFDKPSFAQAGSTPPYRRGIG